MLGFPDSICPQEKPADKIYKLSGYQYLGHKELENLLKWERHSIAI